MKKFRAENKKENLGMKLGSKAIHVGSFMLAIIIGMSLQNSMQVDAVDTEDIGSAIIVVDYTGAHTADGKKVENPDKNAKTETSKDTSVKNNSTNTTSIAEINSEDEENFSIWDEYRKYLDSINAPQEDYDELESWIRQAQAREGDTREQMQSDKYAKLCYQNNFLEMRRALEKLTGTEWKGEDTVGGLYTGVTMSRNTDALFDKTDTKGDNRPADFMMSHEFINKYKTPEMIKGLKEISKQTFSDITGNEWFAQYIPVAVYFNVIQGYPDGTFKGNQAVSYAEFQTMLYNFYNSTTARKVSAQDVEKAVEEYNAGLNEKDSGAEGKMTDREKLSTNDWYSYYVAVMPTNYVGMNFVANADMGKAMTRGEVATTLCNSEYTGEYYAEFDKLMENKNQKIIFNDIKRITDSIYGSTYIYGDVTPDYFKNAVINYNKAVKAGTENCPLDVYAALKILNEKGIIVGDESGNSNWNKPVTRAEMLVIMQRMAEERRVSTD